MVSFYLNVFVLWIVKLLRIGINIEIKIYAGTALTHMMAALQSSSCAIYINDIATPIYQNLLAIEYVDLAEHSLSAILRHSVSLSTLRQYVDDQRHASHDDETFRVRRSPHP